METDADSYAAALLDPTNYTGVSAAMVDQALRANIG
jgi:hypothetical protein